MTNPVTSARTQTMPHLVVLGAGPTGLEAALRAARDGFGVTIVERGRVGENVRAWNHVRMFSPWSMNVSELARETLAAAGHELPEAGCPTGAELVERYLLPLSRSRPLEGCLREGHEVVAIGRQGLSKQVMGTSTRKTSRFVLLLRREDGNEEILEADLVIDATGVTRTPAGSGPGGMPAAGEISARAAGLMTSVIARGERGGTAEPGQTVLLLGRGHSAATSALELARLGDIDPATRILWAWRSTAIRPFDPREDDPLPERRSLEERANQLVKKGDAVLRLLPGTTVLAYEIEGERLVVHLERAGGREEHVVHRVISNVGFVPDSGIHRELQVHQCYATEGPIKLAAALLGDASADCLTQTTHGVETLLNPEPDFFILGMKSYGRSPHYLMRTGLRQIGEVFDHLAVSHKASPAGAR